MIKLDHFDLTTTPPRRAPYLTFFLSLTKEGGGGL